MPMITAEAPQYAPKDILAAPDRVQANIQRLEVLLNNLADHAPETPGLSWDRRTPEMRKAESLLQRIGGSDSHLGLRLAEIYRGVIAPYFEQEP